MKYKILIFDLDDTLIDGRQSTRTAFDRMLKTQGISSNDASFQHWYEIDSQFWKNWQDKRIEIPEHLRHETGVKSDAFLDWVRSQRVLIYFNHSISQERAIELNRVYLSTLNKGIVPIDGAKETLAYLSQKYTIIVATNGPKAALQHKLEAIGVDSFTTEAFSAEMIGHIKPNVEFFEVIENKYGDYKKEDYLVIGDSLKSDVGFGMNVGIDSCWLNWNGEELEAGYKPTFTITNLRELTSLL